MSNISVSTMTIKDNSVKRFSGLKFKDQQKIIAFLFLLVPTALILVFGYLPFVSMIRFSFAKWDGMGTIKYIGLKNYIDVFTRPENVRVFLVSLYYLGSSVIQMVLALYFGTILAFKMRGQGFFKGILFFPNLINGVAIGFIFLFFFKETGTLNTFLGYIGIKSDILWLTNPKLVNYSIAGTSIWRYLGYNVVMFIGTIQSIPGELYEASEIDGATRWQQFKYIIIPGIMPIIQLLLILSITGSLSAFETPYIMTGGGNGSETFVIRTVNTAFKFNKYGLASAMAIVLTIIILFITLIQNKFFKERV